MSFDPIQLEVLWSRLINVVNEQAAALIRTSFTPVVRDSGDLSACVFDARGYMMAQAVTGTPGHINPMAQCMRYALREYPPETLVPGDVLVTNDPWEASGHLHDVTVITPVFRRSQLVGFFANCCHVIDIGGRVFGAEGREVYEEGLYIPMTKLYCGGEPNHELYKLIRANVRMPDLVLGDIAAQVAGNDVGGRRLVEMMDEFNLASLEPLSDEITARSEAAMRAAIRKVPAGEYTYEICSDGFDEPIRLAVAVRFEGDEVSVDWTGTSPESPWGINVVLTYTHAYTTYAIKCAICPEVPNNEGSFRPLKVTAPPGCILNARRPAPVAARHVLGHFVPLAVHGAISRVVPVPAEGAANIWAVQTQGHDVQGLPYTSIFFTAGGMGARPGRDGLNSTAFPSGISGVPVEVVETVSPLVVHAKEFRLDSGGPGTFRGGLGHSLTLGTRSDRPFTLSAMYDRFYHPARGSAGGKEGACGALTRSDGEVLRPKGKIAFRPDQTVTLHLPGGGGYGDPLERAPGLVAHDVRLGLVTPAAARREYGVVLDAQSNVDTAATAAARAAMRP